jgi:hypothetical protein
VKPRLLRRGELTSIGLSNKDYIDQVKIIVLGLKALKNRALTSDLLRTIFQE